jgi:hypothetical protein
MLVDLELQAITPSTNKLQILFRELAPLSLDSAFDLFPHSFNGVPIHRIPLIEPKPLTLKPTSAR